MPQIGTTQISRTVRRKIKKINSVHLNFGNLTQVSQVSPVNQESPVCTSQIQHVTESSVNNSVELEEQQEIVVHLLNSSHQQVTTQRRDITEVNTTFKEDLAFWAVNHNIRSTSLTDLLRLLKRNECFGNLPSDSRTLLQTPRTIKVIELTPGKYVHFPLKDTVPSILQKYNTFQEEIHLQLNIDGLPISKSSSQQFWPILAHIIQLPSSTPFVIGLYFGDEKPKYSNEFLKYAVSDINDCKQLLVKNKVVSISIHSIVCDAPARSFVLNIKGHTGYFGCHKCEVEGDYLCHRMTFPDFHRPLRTDHSFRQKLNEDHHLEGDSELLKLDIDIVKQVPLDYQHLVCLGVVRKLLNCWTRGKLNCRISPHDNLLLCRKIIELKQYFSKDFGRKPRSLKYLSNWKATEFRTFVLYVGPVVLQNILPTTYYKHFLCLHVAITILCSKKYLSDLLDYAESLLLYFVNNFGALYGDQSISYNVHNLIHLANDCRTYGVLDNFSTFIFENFLGRIKGLVRSGNRPLEQIHNRICELQSVTESSRKKSNPNPQPFDFGKEFDILSNRGDNVCILNDNSVFVVKDFVSSEAGVFLRGNKLLKERNLYTEPCESSRIGIRVFERRDPESTVSCAHVQGKALLFEHNSQLITFPILHTDTH